MIPEELFDRYLRRACAVVDDLTLGRLDLEALPSPMAANVRDGICQAAELFYEGDGRRGVVSENNDGFSITFAAEDYPAAGAVLALVMALRPTGLLYRGMGL